MQWNEDTQRYEENPELDKFISDTYAIQVQAEKEGDLISRAGAY